MTSILPTKEILDSRQGKKSISGHITVRHKKVYQAEFDAKEEK